MRPTLQYRVDPLNDMQRLRTLISMESFSATGIRNALSNLIPSLRGNFEMFSRKFVSHEPAITLKGNEKDFFKLVNSEPYLNITSLPAYVPEGLAVSYPEYLNVLQDAVDHCTKNTLTLMNEYSLFLAQIVTNRELKHTVRSNLPKMQLVEKERKALIERMGKCFNQTATTNVSYGDVVARNADWPSVFEALEASNRAINFISRDTLHKKADECNRLLEIVIKHIKAGQYDDVGPEVTSNLSEGAFQAASELEFFSVVYYKLTTLNTAVADTMKDVTTAIKTSKK